MNHDATILPYSSQKTPQTFISTTKHDANNMPICHWPITHVGLEKKKEDKSKYLCTCYTCFINNLTDQLKETSICLYSYVILAKTTNIRIDYKLG